MKHDKAKKGRKPNPVNQTDPYFPARIRHSTRSQIMAILGMIGENQQATLDDVVKAALTVAPKAEIVRHIPTRN